MVISYLTIEIVSRPGVVTREEHALRENMHVTPESELDSAKMHRTLMWSRALIVFGVVLTVLLIVLYAIPYQQAIDEAGLAVIRETGMMSGEMILSICIGLAIVVSGALAYWGAIRSFSRGNSGSSRVLDKSRSL